MDISCETGRANVAADQIDIFGVWKLRAFYLENPENHQRFEPFGTKPRGTFIMHPGGRMV
jgi:hypothetical protein